MPVSRAVYKSSNSIGFLIQKFY